MTLTEHIIARTLGLRVETTPRRTVRGTCAACGSSGGLNSDGAWVHGSTGRPTCERMNVR